jgi:hypothetical protein
VRVVTSINGLLRTLSTAQTRLGADVRCISTGLAQLDALAPGGGFALGAIHEVLGVTATPPFLLPVLVARAAAGQGGQGVQGGWVAWCDTRGELYPPALAAMGLPLDRLLVLRPKGPADALWALAECLQCKGVAACVAAPPRLSRVQARRLQLAAERGGGVGILIRPAGALRRPYAAATRWMARPAPGGRMIQRCSVELVHGHGGCLGKNILLEVCRETHHVRALEAVADRPAPAQAIPASA